MDMNKTKARLFADMVLSGYNKKDLQEFLAAYQMFTEETNICELGHKYPYIVTNLASEAGEVAGLYAKFLRDKTPSEVYRDKLKKELGDIMWHVSELCNEHCFNLEDIILGNVHKLVSRLDRDAIKGEGDDR